MKTHIGIAALVVAVVAGLAGCAGPGGPVRGAAPAADAAGAASPTAVRPSRELRLIQYNIRSFEGSAVNWDRCNEVVKRDQMIERFALELGLYNPDVICLEEVPSEAAAARLAARMGMHYAHFKGGWKSKGWPEGISGAVLDTPAGPISKRLKSAKVLFEGAFRTNPDDPTSYALSDHVPVLAVFSMP